MNDATIINSYLRLRELPGVTRWMAFRLIVIRGIRFNYDGYYILKNCWRLL